MSIVIVGADHLGGIEKNLYNMGVTELVHISGRKGSERSKFSLHRETAFVLVLTDYVNHLTAKNVKCVAKSLSIPMVFAKRSWRDIECKLAETTIKGLSMGI